METQTVEHNILIAKKTTNRSTPITPIISDISDPPRPDPHCAMILRIGKYTSYTAPSRSMNGDTLFDSKLKNIKKLLQSGSHRSRQLQQWFDDNTNHMNADSEVIDFLKNNIYDIEHFTRKENENGYTFIADVMGAAQQYVDNDNDTDGSWNPSMITRSSQYYYSVRNQGRSSMAKSRKNGTIVDDNEFSTYINMRSAFSYVSSATELLAFGKLWLNGYKSYLDRFANETGYCPSSFLVKLLAKHVDHMDMNKNDKEMVTLEILNDGAGWRANTVNDLIKSDNMLNSLDINMTHIDVLEFLGVTQRNGNQTLYKEQFNIRICMNSIMNEEELILRGADINSSSFIILFIHIRIVL